MKFYAMGDTGSFPKIVKELANKIIEDDKSNKNRFLALVGDNFYQDGISFDKTKALNQWEKYIETFPYYPITVNAILGNHDYLGDIWAQVNSKAWEFPYLYYFKKIGKCGFWFLDSQILAPECPGDISPYQVMTGHIDKKVSPKGWKYEKKKHIDWLKKTLKENDDLKYKFFFGHFPLASMGAYDTRHGLGEILCPLMKKYDVSAYISGHDHNAQHVVIEYEGFEINQFVVGSTMKGSPYHKFRGNRKNIRSNFFSNETCFLKVEIKKGESYFDFISEKGESLYSLTLEYV